jgi:valyl-tRNA synthetase
MNIAPGRQLTVLVRGGSGAESAWLDGNRDYIRTLARLERIEPCGDSAPEAATALAGEMTLLIPLADLIDPHAEKERLGKELAARGQEAARIAAKLGNAQFVERAPAEVVEKERRRHDELQQVLATLGAQLQKIEALLADRA